MPNRLFRWGNFLPQTPAGVTFKCVFAGDTTSFAIDSNNYGWATGLGTSGQLGDGSTVSKCVWVKICCDYQYCKIDGSCNHAVAIKTDGTAVAWGNNTCGKLGDNSITTRCQPVAVCCNYCYKDISACSCVSVGVKTDGLAVAWGCNGVGQLGDGTLVSKCQPVAVCCNYCYDKIVTSAFHVLGLKTDGCAVSWGANACGQLGNGTITGVCQPVAVCCNYTYCCLIAASGGNGQSIGIKTDGCAVSWGNNPNGVLGDGTSLVKCQPVAVCCNYTYCKICMGFYHVIAIKTDGLAVAWGGPGSGGALGDGTLVSKCQPVAVCCDYCYCDISAALIFSMGVRRDGIAFAWGCNSSGQFGNGTTISCCVPTQTCTLTV